MFIPFNGHGQKTINCKFIFLFVVVDPRLSNYLADISVLHPSSIIKIVIFRQSKARIKNHIVLVGLCSRKVFDLVENV